MQFNTVNLKFFSKIGALCLLSTSVFVLTESILLKKHGRNVLILFLKGMSYKRRANENTNKPEISSESLASQSVCVLYF